MEIALSANDENQNNNKLEKKSIMVSIAGLIVLAVIGIASGILTDSITMIIQAFLYIIDAIVAILSLKILKKLTMPPDDEYPFGYYKLEPALVNSQGALMIAGATIGIMFSIQDIIHEDNVGNYFVLFSSTFILLIINLSIWFYLYTNYKRLKSSFLKAASLEWVSNLYETIGIIIGFIICYLMQHSGNNHLEQIAPYIDPAMAIILSLFILKIPIKLYKESLVDLLDANPGKEISAKIADLTEGVLKEKFNVESQVAVKLRKAGRGMFLVLSFSVPAHYPFYSVQDMMKALTDKLNAKFRNIITLNFHITSTK